MFDTDFLNFMLLYEGNGLYKKLWFVFNWI